MTIRVISTDHMAKYIIHESQITLWSVMSILVLGIDYSHKE